MPRKPRAHGIMIKSWADVENLLRELGDLNRAIEAHKAKRNERVNELRAKLDEAVSPAKLRKAQIERGLFEFTVAHQPDLRARSKKLTFGEVALRLARKIKNADGIDDDAIIERLEKNRKLKRFVRVEKKIDRAGIKNSDVPPEALAEVGLEISVYDTFIARPAEIDAHPTEES